MASAEGAHASVTLPPFFFTDFCHSSQLGEIIEKTLARMRCPHPIRSHQIRGLDFINIHPVIQWLVKKVLEVRKEVRSL